MSPQRRLEGQEFILDHSSSYSPSWWRGWSCSRGVHSQEAERRTQLLSSLPPYTVQDLREWCRSQWANLPTSANLIKIPAPQASSGAPLTVNPRSHQDVNWDELSPSLRVWILALRSIWSWDKLRYWISCNLCILIHKDTDNSVHLIGPLSWLTGITYAKYPNLLPRTQEALKVSQRPSLWILGTKGLGSINCL